MTNEIKFADTVILVDVAYVDRVCLLYTSDAADEL